MPDAWFYKGKAAYVPPTADISPEFLPSGDRKELVQRVLDQTPLWGKGDDPIETIELRYGLVAVVIETFGAPVIWAKHAGHHAKNVGLSPFVRAERSYTKRFTAEFSGTSGRPMVVRAYPGDYMPPLPWMGTAGDADGGRAACVEFWRNHAYVLTSRVVVPESKSDTPPEWFTRR